MTGEARTDAPKPLHTPWERVFDDNLSPVRAEALKVAGFRMNWLEYADTEAPELIGFRVLEKSDDTCDAVATAIINVERTGVVDAETINASDGTDINQGYRLRLLDEDPHPARWATQLAVLDELLVANP